MKNYRAVNLSLKFSRLSKGLTACKLAKRIGITSVYMSIIEQGRIPSIKVQRKIARSLGVSKNLLFNGNTN